MRRVSRVVTEGDRYRLSVTMRTFFIVWIAAAGLCVGSFLSVVTSRVPVGGSILSPSSTCPGCGARILWFDNVPVLSWIALRGQCRTCTKSIPLRYPVLELGTGTVFGLVAGLAPPAVVPFLLVASAGVIASVTTWLMHGRFSGRVALVSAVIAGFVAIATLVVEFASR